MADATKIEWTDATWQIVTGCSVVSPGCTNCYAMGLAGTRLRNHPSRVGLTRDTKAGPVWTGEVRFNEQWLTQPLQWKRPRMIFVAAHGDLFHESVQDAWLDRIVAVMALSPGHTFQVLTKRSDRMREYLSDPAVARRVYLNVCDMVDEFALNAILIAPGVDERLAPPGPRIHLGVWPLRNVWLGVSAEDQRRADERIPDLLATPAAVRWVSAEPLLGPIDFLTIPGGGAFKMATSMLGAMTNTGWHNTGLSWVVVGGESGHAARPMHPAWARSIRDQCAAAGVAFFFKQWGQWVTEDQSPENIVLPSSSRGDWATRDDEGAWGGDLTQVYNVGKKAAGRLLDGSEHNDMPQVRA